MIGSMASPASSKGSDVPAAGDMALADLLAAKLLVYAKSHGPAFCRYGDECANTNGARLILTDDEKGLKACGPLLDAIRVAKPDLVVAKSVLKEALGQVHEAMTKSKEANKYKQFWHMSVPELEDWTECLQRRIRNSLRCVRQGLAKSPRPEWTNCLPWVAASGSGSSGSAGTSRTWSRGSLRPREDETAAGAQDLSGSPSSSQPASAKRTKIAGKLPAYEFGFLPKVMLPWRCKQGTQFKETSLPIVVPEYTNPSARIVAHWPDGYQHEIDLTVEEYLEMQKSVTKGKDQAEIHWEGKHKPSGHTLTMVQKVDRELLLLLREQSKQVLQIKVKLFGECPSDVRVPSTSEVLKSAIEFLQPIASLYADGMIERSGLIAERDRRMKEQNIGRKPDAKFVAKPNVLKRPAAAGAVLVASDDEDGQSPAAVAEQQNDLPPMPRTLMEMWEDGVNQ